MVSICELESDLPPCSVGVKDTFADSSYSERQRGLRPRCQQPNRLHPADSDKRRGPCCRELRGGGQEAGGQAQGVERTCGDQRVPGGNGAVVVELASSGGGD